MCYNFVVLVLFVPIGCATYITFTLYLTAWRWHFCEEPKHVAKYSSNSYTKIIAIEDSNFTLS